MSALRCAATTFATTLLLPLLAHADSGCEFIPIARRPAARHAMSWH